MNGNWPDKQYGHMQRLAPKTVKFTNSGASGTYQASAANVGKLHMCTSTVATMVEQGTGASVTVSTGTLIPANTVFLFRPVSGIESMGFKTLSGSAFSATDPFTCGVLE